MDQLVDYVEDAQQGDWSAAAAAVNQQQLF